MYSAPMFGRRGMISDASRIISELKGSLKAIAFLAKNARASASLPGSPLARDAWIAR
ncbi:hypothetical protein D9M68_982010 [compost metagenome]